MRFPGCCLNENAAASSFPAGGGASPFRGAMSDVVLYTLPDVRRTDPLLAACGVPGADSPTTALTAWLLR